MRNETKIDANDINNAIDQLNKQGVTLGSDATGIRTFSDGLSGSVYGFSAGGEKFVIKIFEGEISPLVTSTLTERIAVQKYLHEEGQLVPEIMGDALTIQGKDAVVFRHVEGKHLTHPTNDQLFQIGAAIASFHNTTSNLPKFSKKQPSSVRIALKEIFDIIERVLDQGGAATEVKHVASLGKIFIGRRKTKMELGAQNLPRGIIHGDTNRGNILFENGELSGIIDLGTMHENLLVGEVCKTILHFATMDDDGCIWSSNKMRLDMGAVTSIISGYNSERQLSMDEQMYLPFGLADLHNLYAAGKRKIVRSAGEEAIFDEKLAPLRVLAKNPDHYFSLLADYSIGTNQR
jgi:Ser/Thr protein kinase RdoA (MazF antagonist)